MQRGPWGHLSLGELLFKKQKRLEEVDRSIRNCTFQIDFCKVRGGPAAAGCCCCCQGYWVKTSSKNVRSHYRPAREARW